MRKTWSVPVFLALLGFSGVLQAQSCRVLDVELQESYAGPCVDGLAEGYGLAQGTARYEGEFRAGLKHGKGVKLWPNGDRYAGEFVDDRKEGGGTYTWGRGPWAGERYEGMYRDDRRHGQGTYSWANGDLYRGPWENDIAVGPPTPMMQARAKFDEEARAAVAQVGRKVCREVPVGIGERDWVSGLVVGLTGDKVAVRIGDAGSQPHLVSGVELRPGEVMWDDFQAWTPCW